MKLNPQELAAYQHVLATTAQRLLDHIAEVEAENELLKVDLGCMELRLRKAQEGSQ